MTRWAWILAVLWAVALAGCTSGGAPILDAPRTLPGTSVLLAPEVRVARPSDPTANDTTAQLLGYELRTALDGAGVTVSDGSGNQALAPLRTALLAAWQRQRTRGGGRYRAGAEIPLGEAMDEPEVRGIQNAILPVLSREGISPREDGFLPLPADHLPTPPEARPDYIVPQTGGAAGAVTLDLLVVDVAAARVVAQRRASFPAMSDDDVKQALPVLAREVARGLSGAAAR